MKLIGNDAVILRSYFNEAASLLGTDVLWSKVKKKSSNIYDDKELEYENPVQISILLESHPTIKTFNKYGWFTENKDSEDMIGFFPHNLDISRSDIIEFESDIGVVLRKFEISAITQHYDYPTHWICKLIPYTHDVTSEPKHVDVPDDKLGQFIPPKF